MLLNEMEIFYYIVQLKSFSKAAEKLGVSKAYISKRLAKLEQSLNTRLLTRSTRQLTLTEAGKNFYQFCDSIVHEAEKSYEMIQELQVEPIGLLKISVPPAIGLSILAAFLPIFLQRYPQLKLNIQLENKLVNMVEEGYDLVLRAGKLESSNLHMQKVLSVKHVLCATPHYFKKFGVPENPGQLEKHNCAIYGHSQQSTQLQFTQGDTVHQIAVRGNLISNHLHFIKAMVLNNFCLAMFPEHVVRAELKNKILIACLQDYQLPVSDLYAVYPEREFMPLKLQLFITALREFLDTH